METTLPKRNTALAVVAALLSLCSHGQDIEFSQNSEPVLIAEELFGDNAVTLTFPAGSPLVTLTPSISTNRIQANTEFEVTFTLRNATFDQPVSVNDLRWEVNGATVAEITASRSGGGSGDNSVSFTVTFTMAQDLTVGPSMLVFELPGLETSGLRQGMRDASVAIDIDQPTSRAGTDPVSRDLANGQVCGPNTVVAPEIASCPVVRAQPAYMVDVMPPPGAHHISLDPADSRAVLVDAAGVALPNQRVSVAQVRVMRGFDPVAVTVHDLGGQTVDPTADPYFGPLAGQLEIEVSSSELASDDVLYIDENDNGSADAREMLALNRGVANSTLLLGEETHDIWYAPSGSRSLKHDTQFKTSATATLSDHNTVIRRTMPPGLATLRYHGVDHSALAYAIAPPSANDTANVRVKCESSVTEGCTVFFDCYDPDGSRFFGEGGVIKANATIRWDQQEISNILASNWSGRLACEILSTQPISTQVLTRSEGILVNNTPVNR